MISWVQDSWTDLVAPGEGVAPSFVAVKHEACYLAPLTYRSWVDILTEVTEIRRSSMTGTALIANESHSFARITTTWVAFDTQARRARSMTEWERGRLDRDFIGEQAGESAGALLDESAGSDVGVGQLPDRESGRRTVVFPGQASTSVNSL
jgi:hypothetical protein